MKFIHLADLHIGKRVGGISMIEEQKHIFSQVLQLIQAHRPEAVLISGDIYDKSAPGTEAVRVFDQLLTDLNRENVCVLIIAGNHDAPERIDFGGRILCGQGIHFSGVYRGHIPAVTLEDAYGEVDFYLMPFLKPAFVRGFFPEKQIDSYDDAVSAALSGLPLHKERRNVLLSHQFYIGSGSAPERTDSETVYAGGLDSVHTRHIAQFDYAALGHLHGSQQAGLSHIRYCGSPLKYSASECCHTKSALLVELREKGDLTITALPLRPLHDMRKIKGPIDALLSPDVLSQGDPADYLHITLTDDEEIHDAFGRLRLCYPNIMSLAFDNRRTQALAAPAALPEAGVSDPFTLFADFFAMQNGRALTEAQKEIIHTLLADDKEVL